MPRHRPVSGIFLALVVGLARVAAARPDLSPELSDVSVNYDATVDIEDVEEGCAGGETGRVLVNFTTTTHSLGPDDLFLGDPGCPDCALHPGAACANPLFVCSTAHGHPHFNSFAKADLLDANGVVVASGRKQGFCLEDFECDQPKYDCGFQGISVGCSDIYNAGLPCQYIDITDANVPDGDYTIRLTQDPDNVIDEAKENNNVATAPVHIGPAPPPPPTHCPVYTATDLPRAIPDPGDIDSFVHVPRQGIVESLRVVDLHGTHQNMDNLLFRLTSPQGTVVRVLDAECGSTQDFHLDLADAAPVNISCPATDGSLHRPSSPLSPITGEQAAGDWKMNVVDFIGPAFSGTWEGWGLEVCLECGNGTVDPGEVCDDGNADDGDCCSSDCQTIGADGTTCTDPNGCTVNGSCVAGTCTGGTPTCDRCLTCQPPNGCMPPPAVQCDLQPPRSASVTMTKNPLGSTRDALRWHWASSLPVALLDFGSPTTVTDLTLCVFDQTGLKLSATAPAGGLCRGKPCWTATSSSIKYSDRDATPDGVVAITAAPGAPGRAHVNVRAKGTSLGLPALGLTGPVTVRLKRNSGPVCWESRFTAPRRNDAGQYRASVHN